MDRYRRTRRLRSSMTAVPGIGFAYSVADPADCLGTSGSRCSRSVLAQAREWTTHPLLPVHNARISKVVFGIAPWHIAVIAAALLVAAVAVVAGRRRRTRRRQNRSCLTATRSPNRRG
jgi:hypothetical protein